MTENNDLRTVQQSTATVQSGLIGHLVQPGPEYQLLEIFIGKWINQGHTITSADGPAVPILTSDSIKTRTSATACMSQVFLSTRY